MSKKSFHIHNLPESTVRDIKLLAAATGDTVATVIERAVSLLRSNSDVIKGGK